MPPNSPVISRPCNPDRFCGAAGFLAQIGKLLDILGLSAHERHHTVVVAAPGSSKTPLGWMDPFKILCVVLMERRMGGAFLQLFVPHSQSLFAHTFCMTG